MKVRMGIMDRGIIRDRRVERSYGYYRLRAIEGSKGGCKR